MTNKQLRQAINNKYEIGDEFRAGSTIRKIGYKYITYIDIHDTTSIDKITLNEFYYRYVS